MDDKGPMHFTEINEHWSLGQKVTIVIVDPGEHVYMYDDMMHTFPALAIVASSYLTDHYRQYLSLIITMHGMNVLY
jgi:hypothetical protein